MAPFHSLLHLCALGAAMAHASVAAVPVRLPARQAALAADCPAIQIFGARETLTPQGFGSAITVIELVQAQFPGTVAEEIIYPAAGADPDDYAQSMSAGVVAVVKQTTAFAERCPTSIIIMHGYSQGAQIMDNAFCGGPDLPSITSSGSMVSAAVAANTAAIILMGNPRHVDGLPFNVGNATEPGFAARPADFSCPEFEDRIQAYCESPDPFCAKGDNPDVHQGYGFQFGDVALDFIVSKVPVAAR